MTKYLLHGGATRTLSKSNHDFFVEIVKNLKTGGSLLICLHAKERQNWTERFEELKKRFIEETDRGDLNYILGSDAIKMLTTQITNAQTIYIHGGETPWLMATLKQISNLKSLFKNKVIAGSSAGAYVLSKYYYSNDYNNFN